jgi:hypothetical protein
MAYSDKLIAEAVSTVHMNSKRQSRRNETINYANGDINFIGDCCFAYSGDISVPASEVSMLDFKTGPSFLKVEFETHGTFSQIGQNQVRVHVLFNDNDIIDTYFDASLDYGILDKTNLIIPPFTRFVLKMNQASGSNKTMQVTLIGKVYAGAEVIQGAI